MSDIDQKLKIDTKAAKAALKDLQKEAENIAVAVEQGDPEGVAKAAAEAEAIISEHYATLASLRAEDIANAAEAAAEAATAEQEVLAEHLAILTEMRLEDLALKAEERAVQLEEEAAQREEDLARLLEYLALQEAMRAQSLLNMTTAERQFTEVKRQEEALRAQITAEAIQGEINAVMAKNATLFALNDEQTKKIQEAQQAAANVERTLEQAQFAFHQGVKNAEIAFDKMTAEQKITTVRDGLTNVMSLLKASSKDQGNVAKAAAIAEATVQTYRAANGAYAALAPTPFVGPALGAAAAAAAVAAGLANIRQIQNQKFAMGGIVGGHSLAGDFNAVRVNSGELILNRAQQDSVAAQLSRGPSDSQEIVAAIRENTAAVRNLQLVIGDKDVFDAVNREVQSGRRIG